MKRVLLIAVLVLAACHAPRPPLAEPGPDTTCAFCGMSVADRRFASQVVVDAEPPRFFDDLNCLSGFLKRERDLPASAHVFVADHRTKEWVPAASAVFTRVPDLVTPMGSGIVAHKNVMSREADPRGRRGQAVDTADVLPALAGK